MSDLVDTDDISFTVLVQRYIYLDLVISVSYKEIVKVIFYKKLFIKICLRKYTKAGKWFY